MPFAFQGNIYADDSIVINSTINNTYLSTSTITLSSIDMLNTSGNYQNITNTALPINPHDVAIKLYVDNLGININTFTLTNTQGTSISSAISGSFIITITNLVLNGPSATFHITKNNSNICGHVVRTTLSPGLTTLTALNITWPINSNPQLSKSDFNYDGAYQVKII